MIGRLRRGWSVSLQTVAGASRSLLLCLVSGFWLLVSLPAPAIVDSNLNGVSDLWEEAYNSGQLFDETFNPQADPDGDGWTNAQEAAAGTDPFDPNPPDGIIRPDIVRTPAGMGEENGEPVVITPEVATVSWPTTVGKLYTLLASPDLSQGSWITVGDPFIGTSSIPEFHFETQPADKIFWRVKVEDADSDGDNLTNAEENQLGTDPYESDTDHDGISDFDEHTLGTNPIVPRITEFTEIRNGDGTLTYTWKSYASNGDWFHIESKQPDGTWKANYSTTYGSAKLPFVAGALHYSLTLDPASDFAP